MNKKAILLTAIFVAVVLIIIVVVLLTGGNASQQNVPSGTTDTSSISGTAGVGEIGDDLLADAETTQPGTTAGELPDSSGGASNNTQTGTSQGAEDVQKPTVGENDSQDEPSQLPSGTSGEQETTAPTESMPSLSLFAQYKKMTPEEQLQFLNEHFGGDTQALMTWMIAALESESSGEKDDQTIVIKPGDGPIDLGGLGKEP